MFSLFSFSLFSFLFLGRPFLLSFNKSFFSLFFLLFSLFSIFSYLNNCFIVLSWDTLSLFADLLTCFNFPRTCACHGCDL